MKIDTSWVYRLNVKMACHRRVLQVYYHSGCNFCQQYQPLRGTIFLYKQNINLLPFLKMDFISKTLHCVHILNQEHMT